MRKLLAVGALMALASLAAADCNVNGANVPVCHVSKSSSKTPTAFIPTSLEQSKALLSRLQRKQNADRFLEECVDLALDGAGSLNKSDVSVSYIEICPDGAECCPVLAHVQGEEMQYASGVARLVYGASLYYKLQAKKTGMTVPLERDVIAMLRDGNVGATNRIVDFVTGTASGDELPYGELNKFAKDRDYANWYLTNLGFKDFNVNQKVNLVAASGRDRQLLGEKLHLNYENSNRVTANQIAGIMYLLDQEALVSPGASHAMKAYMHRPLEQTKVGYLPGIAAGLPTGSKVVSINGYTVRNYADAALVTLPSGVRYVLVAMTKYNEYPTNFIPLLSRIIAFRNDTSTGTEDVGQHRYIAPLAAH